MRDKKQDFEVIVRPHFEALHKAAFRLTRRRHDAEDLVQEVCLRAYSELHKLETLDYALGWLLRVQYRLFVDGVRRRRRSLISTATEFTDLADRFASDNPGPEELTEASRRHRHLEAAWERLSTEQRALLGLHAEGYKLSELAQITGRSRNALSARLHRARMRLSKLIDQELPTKERLAHLEKQNELS